MGNLRAFRVLIVLFLTLGIFTNSVMAEICFCGEACSHVFPNNVKRKEIFPFHNHCVGTHCKSCNFEDGQALKGKNPSSKAPNFLVFNTPTFIFTLTTYHLNNHLGDGVTSWICTGGKVQFTPIYLQNRCLLF